MLSKEQYNQFIEQYKHYPMMLASLIKKDYPTYVSSQENEFYNQGTNNFSTKESSETHITVANSNNFERAYQQYKKLYPHISDQEAQARVVFDFLKENGSNFSYEKNHNDILFADVTRERFYSEGIFKDAISSTNYFDQHIGDIQILCLAQKKENKKPEAINETTKKIIDNFYSISDFERSIILHKRGFYHESIHLAMKTADERKCDTFALLKIMKEHPLHAKKIYDFYNLQRSCIRHTLKTMHKKKPHSNDYIESIRVGVMTYLMPNTYKKLEKYAMNPTGIPNNDSDLVKLTCFLTKDIEFSEKQLSDFTELMQKKDLSLEDLEKNEIIKICQKQSGIDNFKAYLLNYNNFKDIKIITPQNTTLKATLKKLTSSLNKKQIFQTINKTKYSK